MLACGYPGYLLHSSMHKLLLQQLDSVQSLENDDYRQSWVDRMEIAEFIHICLIYHIAEDRKLETATPKKVGLILG